MCRADSAAPTVEGALEHARDEVALRFASWCFGAHHSECLAAAGLSVRKDRAVGARQTALHHTAADMFKQLLLRRVLIGDIIIGVDLPAGDVEDHCICIAINSQARTKSLIELALNGRASAHDYTNVIFHCH